MTGIDTPTVRHYDTVRPFETLLAIGLAFTVIGIVGSIIDRPGLGWYGTTQPSVDAELDFDVDFGNRLTTTVVDDGIVDAATAQAPVTIGQPVTAHFVFTDPSTSQRAVWVIWQVSDFLVPLVGTWLVFSIVRSARRGDPFVAANERRLWMLALVIALGGTAMQLVGGFCRLLMLQRSAAAEMTMITASISFMPIIIGLGVAVLASVWHVGVGLRDDVEGMI